MRVVFGIGNLGLEAAEATIARAREGIRLGAERAMGEISRRDLDPPPDPA